jgi:hypothetical protein
MDDTEIARVRREIRRTFGSSPHKKKYWLALLEMYLAAEKGRGQRQLPEHPLSADLIDRIAIDS